jgi:hypothetical protein
MYHTKNPSVLYVEVRQHSAYSVSSGEDTHALDFQLDLSYSNSHGSDRAQLTENMHTSMARRISEKDTNGEARRQPAGLRFMPRDGAGGDRVAKVWHCENQIKLEFLQ